VTILLGAGDGSFTEEAGSPYSVGLAWTQSVRGITSTDFDGDGHQDLTVSSNLAGKLTILLGAGDGSFSEGAGSPYDMENGGPIGITSADFNGDGYEDLAVNNYDKNKVTILLGQDSYQASDSAQSTAIDLPAIIHQAIFTANTTSTARTVISYSFSADDGTTWVEADSGETVDFVGAGGAGKNLKWKVTLETTDSSATPQIYSLSLSYSYYTTSTQEVLSQSITPNEVGDYDKLEINQTLGSSGSIQYQILNQDGETLITQAAAGATTTIDLFDIDASLTKNKKLQLKAVVSTTDSQETPEIDSWTAYWIKAKAKAGEDPGELSEDSLSVTAGNTVYFDATDSVGSDYRCQWDFDGDGNFDTTATTGNCTTSHQYDSSGDYTVTLRQIQGTATAIDEDTFSIEVEASTGGGRPPSFPTTLNLSADPAQIEADRETTSIISAEIIDQYGKTMPFEWVNFRLQDEDMGILIDPDGNCTTQMDDYLYCSTNSAGVKKIVFQNSGKVGQTSILVAKFDQTVAVNVVEPVEEEEEEAVAEEETEEEEEVIEEEEIAEEEVIEEKEIIEEDEVIEEEVEEEEAEEGLVEEETIEETGGEEETIEEEVEEEIVPGERAPSTGDILLPEEEIIEEGPAELPEEEEIGEEMIKEEEPEEKEVIEEGGERITLAGLVRQGKQILEEKVYENKQVQETNKEVAIPTVATVAVVNTVATAAASGGSLFFLLQYILQILKYFFTQPLYLLSRKRKSWGIVYNTVTKEPIGLAMVRLYQETSQGKKLVQTKVTGRDGRYFFLVKPQNKYSLEVTHNHYTFPSRKITEAERENIYSRLNFGQSFVADKKGVVNFNLPLDLKEGRVSIAGTNRKMKTEVHDVDDFPLRSKKEERKQYQKIIKEIRKEKLGRTLALLAPAIALVNLVLSPGWLAGVFVALHLALYFFFRQISVRELARPWGKTIEKKSGQALPQTVVHLFEPRYGKKLGKPIVLQVSDGRGRYGFLIGEEVYYLVAEKPGYRFSQKAVEVRGKEEGIIKENLKLEKAL